MQIAGSFSTISAAKARANLGLGPNNTPQFGSLLIGGTGGQGSIGLSNGDATHTGYFAFYMPDTTRFGYMGYTTGSNCDIVVEKSGGFFNFVAQGDRLGPRVNNNEILHNGNFPAPTVLADLADAKKRLDNPGLQQITYYGAKHWNFGEAVVDSGPSVQAAVNACKGSADGRIIVNVPGGSFRVETPILTDRATVVRGVHPELSRFVSRANNLTVWNHNTEVVTSARVGAPWDMSNLSFHVDAYGPSIALDIRQDGMYGGFNMKNVHFRSFNDAFNWKNHFMKLRGVVSGVADGIVGTGSAYNPANQLTQATPIAILIESVNNALPFYGLTILNSRLGARDHCVMAQVLGPPGDSGTIEGIIMRDSFMRSCYGAAFRQYVSQSAGYWRPPLYIFDAVNTEGPGPSMQIDSVDDLWIDKCWFMQTANYIDQKLSMLDFLYVSDLRIRDSKIMAFAGSNVDALLNVRNSLPSRGGVTGCERTSIRGLVCRADEANNGLPAASVNCGTAIGAVPGLRFETPDFIGFEGRPNGLPNRVKMAGTGPNIAL